MGQTLRHGGHHHLPRPHPHRNDILVKLLYISVDPYMRGMMRVNTASYRSGFSLNAPMSGGCIAQVLESRHPKFPVNTLLLGSMSWQDVQVIPA
ncbi:chaperonin 10-like protein, partial [Chytridium lagenaria]